MKMRIKRCQVTFRTLILALVTIFGTIILSGCGKDNLDVQEDFPFDVRIMPVPKDIAVGEKVEIRFTIISGGNYSGNAYRLRYFQNDGEGQLNYLYSKPFVPNDYYAIPEKEFRLYFTSTSNVRVQFDIWIADSFGNEKQFSFQFNNKKSDPIFTTPIR